MGSERSIGDSRNVWKGPSGKKRITQRIWFAHQASYGGRSERRGISGEQQRGEKFWERKRKMVSCSVCGETVVASSIRNPMELSYGVIPQQMQ